MKKKCAAVLKYYRDLSAPLLVGKGFGSMAEKIIACAREHEVPVVENDIAETLMHINTMSVIDEEFFEVIAEIYSYITERDQQAG
ncbi:MAG: hypothetical protein A2096_04650 [Spirochaetes bacterium GWF1_41_5]|nr:MAG: hypothetical protein A2096_04650 [Spirochaetes bacterium GWF1_41_5]